MVSIKRVCLTCGKEYRLGCVRWHTWENNYCCKECWQNSDDYKKIKEAYKSLQACLSLKQRENLKLVLYYVDDTYREEIREWNKIN